jgi:hypothetical protein
MEIQMTQADVVLSTPRTGSFLFRLSERELDRRDVTADVLEELLIPDTAAVADAIVQDCAIRPLRSGPRSGDRPGIGTDIKATRWGGFRIQDRVKQLKVPTSRSPL